MRPRHKAAENPADPVVGDVLSETASMRPRHKAAENRNAQSAADYERERFNEAAA